MTWIYLMWNIPFFWKVKVGISQKIRKRQSDVSKSTPGFVFIILPVPLPWGVRRLEQDIHRLCRRFHCPFPGANGGTEWFYFVPVAPIAATLLLITAALYWSPVIALAWFVWANW